MKNLYLLTTTVIFGIMLQAQTTKEIPLTSTNNIELTAPVNVVIYKSDNPRLVIKGNVDPNSININPTENGVTISSGNGKIDDNAVIEIYTNNIQNISGSGPGDIEMKDEFNPQDFNLTMGGSGDFKGLVRCQNANITATGSSDVKITGSAENVNAVSSGSSDLKLMEFPTKK